MYKTIQEIRQATIKHLSPNSIVVGYNTLDGSLIGCDGNLYEFGIGFSTVNEIEYSIKKNLLPGSANIIVFKDGTLKKCFLIYSNQIEDALLYVFLPAADNTSALEEVKNELERDHLTGVLNRKNILSILDEEINRTAKNISIASILMIDIDDFKAVNDEYGHDAGDEVLKNITKRISSAIRTNDYIGRLGGEEFLVILSGTNISGASIAADKILKAVSCASIEYAGKIELNITVSIGITSTNYFLSQSNTDLLKKADVALYAAKSNGKNCYEIIE